MQPLKTWTEVYQVWLGCMNYSALRGNKLHSSKTDGWGNLEFFWIEDPYFVPSSPVTLNLRPCLAVINYNVVSELTTQNLKSKGIGLVGLGRVCSNFSPLFYFFLLPYYFKAPIILNYADWISHVRIYKMTIIQSGYSLDYHLSQWLYCSITESCV